ncbi:MAG: CoA transferase [Oscillibacter sp.]|jgi:crotonobetainyl-CoA:carnitine CoA-transferase CaiB-like acyl-CoA transferase|nr:CoA transferase [Oscillibacter sp.]
MNAILNGIRVLDLTEGLAGAYCTMNLGDYGAEVIKIESPAGDCSRARGPMKNGFSAFFAGVNRNKKSVCIDYTTSEGRATVLKMAAKCDILVENFAPGRLAELGLDYAAVKAVNPGIIYASITGYGQTGPLKDHPVDDLVITAMSGMMDRTGRRGEDPMMPGVDFGCTYSGVAALSGIAMALYNKAVTGEGTRLEVSMLDCIFYMLELFVMDYSINGTVTPKNGNQDTEVAPLGTFSAKDGHVAIAISSEGQWKKFCGLVGAEQLADDPRFADNAARIAHLDELIVEMGKITGQWKKDELVTLLGENKLAGGALKSVAELIDDPQARATDMIVETTHPVMGDLYLVGSPMKLSKTPVNVTALPAPSLGQHTEEVLKELGLA